MKTASFLLIAVLSITLLFAGCIPSTPPEADSKSPAPIQEQPVASAQKGPEAPERPGTDTQAISEKPDEDSHVAHMQISLDSQEMPPGAIVMPTIDLIPMSDVRGYTLASEFPMDGLSMEGTLLFKEPDEWHLSGKFTSRIPAFSPGKPVAQPMGGSTPDGVNSAEILITFAAPLPPADAASTQESQDIPFDLVIKTPVNTAFLVMLMPF